MAASIASSSISASCSRRRTSAVLRGRTPRKVTARSYAFADRVDLLQPGQVGLA